MGKQGETKFKERVLKDLKSWTPIWVKKTQERGRRGMLDILIIKNGRGVMIELKIDGEEPDPLQKHTIKDIRINGRGIAFATTPTEWPQHFSWLKGMRELNCGETDSNHRTV